MRRKDLAQRGALGRFACLVSRRHIHLFHAPAPPRGILASDMAPKQAEASQERGARAPEEVAMLQVRRVSLESGEVQP